MAESLVDAATAPAEDRRRLVVTADDVGLTAGVNDGCEDLIKAGRLSNISLMVNTPATAEAAGMLKKYPHVSVGLHFNLFQGPPMSADPSGLAPLCGPDGEFFRSLRRFVRAFRGAPGLADAVRGEIEAQLQAFYDTGLSPSHIDIHKFMAFSPVWRTTAEIAAERSIRFVRWPVESDSLRRKTAGPLFWPVRPWLSSKLVSWYTRSCCRPVDGVRTIQCAGTACIGGWNDQIMEVLLSRAEDEQLEIVMHPGRVCEALPRSYTRLIKEREEEMAILMSDRFGELLEKHGWRIAGYNDCQ